MQSAHRDFDSWFATVSLDIAQAEVGGLFSSLLLTLAIFLSPANSLLMLFWIWWSCFAISFYCRLLASVAKRKRIMTKLLGLQIWCYSWIAWGFTIYATFYCGLWAMIHPGETFGFELNWKNALFVFGGFAAIGTFKRLSHVSMSVKKRIAITAANTDASVKD